MRPGPVLVKKYGGAEKGDPDFFFGVSLLGVDDAHCPAFGVNVYTMLPATAVDRADDQVPVIPFVEVVGSIPDVAP